MMLNFYTRPNTTGKTHIVSIDLINHKYTWNYGVYVEELMETVHGIMISKRDFDNIIASLKSANFEENWISEV